MESHPVTNFIGIVGAVFLFIFVSIGFSCMFYSQIPDEYENIKMFIDLAKTKKFC